MSTDHKTHVLTRRNFDQLSVIGTDLKTALASTRSDSSQVIWAESVDDEQDLLTWNIVFENGLEYTDYKMVKVHDEGIYVTMFAAVKTMLCTIEGAQDLTKHLQLHADINGLGRGMDVRELRLVRTCDVKEVHPVELSIRSALINSHRDIESGPQLDNYTQADIELTRIAQAMRANKPPLPDLSKSNHGREAARLQSDARRQTRNQNL